LNIELIVALKLYPEAKRKELDWLSQLGSGLVGVMYILDETNHDYTSG